jgi:hypothetical protein
MGGGAFAALDGNLETAGGAGKKMCEKIWQGLRNTNVWLVLGTWVLAILGFISLRDARESVEISQRAWIAPMAANFSGQVVLGQPADYEVLYRNTGKTPAINVNHAEASNHIPMPNLDAGEYPNIPPNKTCLGLSPESGADILYPATEGDYRLYRQLRSDAINADLRNKKSLEYIQGCFAYETMCRRHHSPWCFFLQPINGQPINAWPFKNCPHGREGQD